VFITLYEELKRLFAKKNLDEISQEEMKQNIGSLQQIFDKVTELNRKNNLLKAKYDNDTKYARIHKRIVENGTVTKRESAIYDTLIDIKKLTDDKVLMNSKVLENEGYFNSLLMPMVIGGFEKKARIELDVETARYINSCVVQEYIREYRGVSAW